MTEQKDCPIIKDWKELRAEIKHAVVDVAEAKGKLDRVSEYVQHLQQLDAIAGVLVKMNEKLAEKPSIERAAAARVWTTTLIILAVIATVSILKDTDKNIYAGTSGFHITSSNRQETPK